MNEESCVVNYRSFYVNDDEKLELFYMQKKYRLGKNNNSVMFIECNELNWNGKEANGLRVYIF